MSTLSVSTRVSNTEPYLLPDSTMPKVNSPVEEVSMDGVMANPNAGNPMQESEIDYLRLILTARVYDVAIETPLQKACNLSDRLSNTVLLKREDLQPVFSFKLRGAYNRMSNLTEAEKEKGVIACSAGNHAQGVALAAKTMGIRATIVMPVATPPIKWKNVERLGAKVVLHGLDFEEAKQECARLCKETGMTNIPPYDDPFVIAGQGTIGVEIFRQYDFRKIDAIFICIGGGGLVAGIASYVKRLNPAIKIVGVEAYDANAMTRSLLAGKRLTLPEVGLFADGAAVRSVGVETFRICRSLVDELVLVTTDEICAAVKDIFEDTRSIMEPAGALGLAGLKKYVHKTNTIGKTLVAITCGANMNFDRLRFVADRADLGERREGFLWIKIPERPGSFAELYDCIHPRNVTEFSYRFDDPAVAHVIISFALLDRDNDLASVLETLDAKGMWAMDLAENEMAKAHARFLVGGRKNVPYERVFRFSFPERLGAMRPFIYSLRNQWNVTLFHYRNYGGDIGKVMAGMSVPPGTEKAFDKMLSEVKYPYFEETDNPIYEYFLK